MPDTGTMPRDGDKTDKVSPLPFPDPSEGDDVPEELWNHQKRFSTAQEDAVESEYATPGVLRRFALWVLRRR